MKKLLFLIAVFLQMILVLPMMNIVGASEDYVGIDVGDVYAWSFNFDEDANDDWIKDSGQSYLKLDTYEEFELLKLEVTEIDSEKNLKYDSWEYFPGVDTDCIVYKSKSENFVNYDNGHTKDVDIFNSEEIDDWMIASLIFDEEFFVATNIDWNNLGPGFDYFFNNKMMLDSWVIETSENKANLKIKFNAEMDYLNKEIEYDDDGVLDAIDISYKGDIIVEIKQIDPPAESLILGYSLMIMLGTSIISILGIITIHLKKLHKVP